MPLPLRIPAETLSNALTHEQRAALKLPSKGELEIASVKENVWLLSISTSQTQLGESAPLVMKPLHQKVLKLLQSHRIPDVIEGRFETLLSSEELGAFEELKAAGKIIAVKTNPRYDKGIYRESKFTDSASTISSVKPKIVNTIHAPILEKPAEEYTLLHDGFMILRSEGAAKAASFDLAERIKAGEVKGIKSFDGFYYIIENSLLERHMSRLAGLLKEKKKADIGELSSEVGIPLVLTRMILEFAKEEGTIIEKQKNVYAYVG